MAREDDRRVAFVTGASRGIGRMSAITLAEAGFDVVVTARTVHEGQAADGSDLPGSIETTADEVRKAGREALALPLDLLKQETLDVALEETMSSWGRIDVLLNNGIYTGDVTMQHVLDIESAEISKLFQANVFAQLYLVQRVLPHMLERGSGTVINMVSAAGLSDPPAPAGSGGWGFAYAASKAAFHRMVGVLAVEQRDSGLRFFNVEPGFVITEAMRYHDPEGHFEQYGGAPPSVPAAVIAWLAQAPEADALSGQTITAQRLSLERGLHPDWRTKR